VAPWHCITSVLLLLLLLGWRHHPVQTLLLPLLMLVTGTALGGVMQLLCGSLRESAMLLHRVQGTGLVVFGGHENTNSYTCWGVDGLYRHTLQST